MENNLGGKCANNEERTSSALYGRKAAALSKGFKDGEPINGQA